MCRLELRRQRASRGCSARARHLAAHRSDRQRERCPDVGAARCDPTRHSLVRRRVFRPSGRRRALGGLSARRALMEIPVSSSPFDEYRDRPLLSPVEATVKELVATRELSVNTAPAYVIGYLCQELAAKKLIVGVGLHK